MIFCVSAAIGGYIIEVTQSIRAFGFGLDVLFYCGLVGFIVLVTISGVKLCY